MALIPASKSTLQNACLEIPLAEKIGEGGNGQVYEGQSPSLGEVAVKFMLNDNKKRYARFRDEVLVVTSRLKDSSRVLPILDSSLPSKPTESQIPWYVMPRALTLKDALAGKLWPEKLAALIELAEGLAEIHQLGVAHRDIKPENLFSLGGTFRFGDFGLAAFPEGAGLTPAGEAVGPSAGFMAPEMLVDSNSADPMKADVYSFAKTVWSVLTGKKRGFLSHYVAGSGVGLMQIAPSELMEFVAEPLDALLDRSTDLDPARRPTAMEFAQTLRAVVAIQGDWAQANIAMWEAAELEALRVPGLTRAEWLGPGSIATVMNLLSRRHGLNHLFLPSGGGVAVEAVSTAEGGLMLSMRVSESMFLAVKAHRLTLERFSEEPAFSYAVLETLDVAALGVEKRFVDDGCELLKRVNEFDFVVDDRDDDEPLNPEVRTLYHRYFKGGLFVLAPTTGIYNKVDDYEGTASELGRDKLRARFQEYFDRREAQPTGFSVKRQVRLLGQAEGKNESFVLKHLDMEQLEKLITLDEAQLKERLSKEWGCTFGGSGHRELLAKGPSESRKAAHALFKSFTAPQRAEYLSLVYLGRGELSPSEFSALGASNVIGEHEDAYLLEKMGNGYMCRALGRFGLIAVRDGYRLDSVPTNS